MNKFGIRGIKQTEIRKCVFCNKGVAHSGHPLFYRFSVEQCGLERQAINRQSGLEMMLGGHAQLANIMGTNEDMASVLNEQKNLWVCLPCMEKNPILYIMTDGYPKPSESEDAA